MSNPDIITATWPVGSEFDVKFKVLDDTGVPNLIGQMNGQVASPGGLEILAIGFKSNMERRRSELIDIQRQVENYLDDGDIRILQDLNQKLIREVTGMIQRGEQ